MLSFNLLILLNNVNPLVDKLCTNALLTGVGSIGEERTGKVRGIYSLGIKKPPEGLEPSTC